MVLQINKRKVFLQILIKQGRFHLHMLQPPQLKINNSWKEKKKKGIFWYNRFGLWSFSEH
jgi:hypothetical protein